MDNSTRPSFPPSYRQDRSDHEQQIGPLRRGGIGSILQVHTRKPTEKIEATAVMDVRERSQYQPEATLSGKFEGVETFVAGRYLDSKGYPLPNSFEGTSIENGDLRQNSERKQGNFFTKLGYRISPETRVDFLADYRKGQFDVPPNVVDDPSDRFAPRTRDQRVRDLEGFSTQLSGQYDPEGPFSLHGWGYVNRQKEDRRNYDYAREA